MIELDKIFINESRIIYYIKGTKIIHRNDGPAVIFSDGEIRYAQYSKLHRIDGPAIIKKDGIKLYYLEGIEYNNIKSDEEWINSIHVKEFIIKNIIE